jgi:hypothetical protein
MTADRAKPKGTPAKPAQAPGSAEPKAKPPASKPSKPSKPPKPANAPASAKPPKPPKAIEKAGDGHRSPDGRFTVEGVAGAWYVADTERPSPLGTPTIIGPFRTLAAVREAIEAARSA